MPFISLQPGDVVAMLRDLGLASLSDLFTHLPSEFRCRGVDLPGGLSQCEAERKFRALARRNLTCDDMLCFLGAGAYDHYVPAPVRELLRRGEFYTAYTPYQPEAAQGILQALFEYQTMICRLTALEVANASLYDGASATWEAVLMAVRHTGRTRVVVDGNLHPNWLEVLATAAEGAGLQIVEAPSGSVHEERTVRPLAGAVTEETAAVVVPNPDFAGRVADLTEAVEAAHRKGALAVVAASPLSLALFKPPGHYGADIACGEGQELGLGLSGGGPYLGYLACRKALVRRMPGRVVGMTVDSRAQRAFTLTLQTREQHIRREKATSNICTNQSLCAMAAGLYLAAMGKEGLKRCALRCLERTETLRGKLAAIGGIDTYKGFCWREFLFRTPLPAGEVCKAMAERGILAGLAVRDFLSAKKSSAFRPFAKYPERYHEGDLLVAVTERRTDGEIARYVEAIQEVVKGAASCGPEKKS